MLKIYRFKRLMILLISLGLFGLIFPKNVGVFVDGSYSPGKKDSRLDKWIDRKLSDAARSFKRLDSGADTFRVSTKKGLEDRLKGLKLKCGDTLTIFMIGHGKKKSFKFTKEHKSVTPKELLKMMKDYECCSKIQVVIFACHSGSFIQPLFKDPHIISVYTSCGPNEKSHSDEEALREGRGYRYVDRGGDWMNGFNHDLRKVKPGTSQADALKEAAKTARKRMSPGIGAKQTPQGWQRGRVKIKAHVERVYSGKKEIKVHFYEPHYLRCQKRNIRVENIPQGLKRCNWISCTCLFGKPKDPIVAVDSIKVTSPPQTEILAHIIERYRKGMKVHIVKPAWLYCRKRVIRVKSKKQLDKNIKKCRWIKTKVVISKPDGPFTTPDSTTPIAPVEPRFRCYAHVEGGINWGKGTFKAHIKEPPWLACRERKIRSKEGLEKLKRDLKSCVFIYADITLKADGTYEASSIRIAGEWTKAFAFDSIPPIVRITAPRLREAVSGRIRIQAEVRDNIDRSPLVEFMVDDALISEDNSPPYECFWDVSGEEPGTEHNIMVKAIDRAGNVGYSDRVIVIIESQKTPEDTVPPMVEIISPADGDTVWGEVHIAVLAEDDSGLEPLVNFLIDGGMEGTDNIPPYEYLWDTSGIEPGSVHTIMVEAIDKAGNINRDEITVMIKPGY